MKKVLVLVRGNEKYIFIFDTRNIKELLNTFNEFVTNPEISFNKHDASVLSKAVCKS